MTNLELSPDVRFVRFQYASSFGKLFSHVTKVYVSGRTDPDGMTHVSYDGLCGGYPNEVLISKFSRTRKEAEDMPCIWMPKRLEEILFSSLIDS